MNKKLIAFIILALIYVTVSIAQSNFPGFPIGKVRLVDSTGYFTINKNTQIYGDFNFTGNIYQNGIPFAGGGGSGIDTNKYLSIYRLDTSKIFFERDTVNVAGLKRANTFLGVQTFNSTSYMSNVDALGVTSTSLNTGKITATDTAEFQSKADFLSNVDVGGSLSVNDSILADRLVLTDAQGVYLPDATSFIWRTTPQISISAQINELIFTSYKTSFYTQYGTRIAEVDSTNGVYCAMNMDVDGSLNVDGRAVLNGYNKIGNNSPAMKFKLVRGKITAVGTYVNMAHGLTDFKKIIGFNYTLLRDTTDAQRKVLGHGANITTQTNMGVIVYADTTNVAVWVPVASTGLIDDSVRVLITYEE